MDKKRKYIDLKCEVCDCDYKQQERIYKTALWKDRCTKHRHALNEDGSRKGRAQKIEEKKENCIDCNDLVWEKNTRCKPCSGKQRVTLDHNKKCVNCSCHIMPNSTRCQKCHNINQNQGKSTERTKFNNSKEWSKVRTEAFKRDNYTCQICKKRGSITLNGHHIKSYKNYQSERLNVNNILTLCVDCHLKLHHDKKFKNKHKKIICD